MKKKRKKKRNCCEYLEQRGVDNCDKAQFTRNVADQRKNK